MLKTAAKMYKVINSRFYKHFLKPQKVKIFYGGAGSGKSVSIAQYFIKGLCSGDGVRRAVLRKTFPSMKLTTYLVLKTILLDWGVPFKDHQTDHYFEVGTNRLYYLSLDDPEKVKGGEFKEIWLEEATEFNEADFNQLMIRLSRDRYSEDVHLFLSYNPIDINHWVVKRAEAALNQPDKTLVHHSTYKDNIKNLSKSFIDELEGLAAVDENFYRVYTLGLPGVLKNKIYSHFQIEDSTKWPWLYLNADCLHCYGLDFGFNHPMALVEVWYHEDEYYVKERYYEREKTTDDLRMWMDLNRISHTDYIFADSAEPDRIEMIGTTGNVTAGGTTRYIERFNAYPAKKDVKAGIDYIKGKRVHICSNSVNLIKEYNNYKYKETKDGDVLDEPVKAFDDACFIAGTFISTDTGKKPIESIKIGDIVLTRNGYREVEACGITSKSSEVKTVILEDGNSISATRNHPIFVIGKGFIPLDTIRYGDFLLCENTEQRTSRKLNSMGFCLEDIQPLKILHTRTITHQGALTNIEELSCSTRKSGSLITGSSQMDITSTIKTETPSTTPSKILNASHKRSTFVNICNLGLKTRKHLKNYGNIAIPSGHLQKNGIHQRRAACGIPTTESRHLNHGSLLPKSAISVERNLRISREDQALDFVQTHVSPNGEDIQELITKLGYVNNAGKNLRLINTTKPYVARRVVGVFTDGKKAKVYNLAVKGSHEYFANGVLSHNCDALRYGIFTLNVMCGLTLDEELTKGTSFASTLDYDVWDAMF